MPLKITPGWLKNVPDGERADLDSIVARINAKLVLIDEESPFKDRVKVIKSWMAPLFELGLDVEKTERAFWVDIESMNKDIQEKEDLFLTECNVLNEVWGWKQDANHVLFERITHFGMGSNQSWTDPIMRFLFYHNKTRPTFIDDFDQKQKLSLETIGTVGRWWDKSIANQLTMGLALWSVYFENLGPKNLTLIKTIFEYGFDDHNTSLPMALFVYQVRAWIYMCLCNLKRSEDQFRRMNFLLSSYKGLPDVHETWSLFEFQVESSAAESSSAESSVGESSIDSGATDTPPSRQGGAAGTESHDKDWGSNDDGVKDGSPVAMSTPKKSRSDKTDTTARIKMQPGLEGSYSTFVV